MDFSKPIGKRTRSQLNSFLKEEYERRRQLSSESNTGRQNEVSGVGGGGSSKNQNQIELNKSSSLDGVVNKDVSGGGVTSLGEKGSNLKTTASLKACSVITIESSSDGEDKEAEKSCSSEGGFDVEEVQITSTAVRNCIARRTRSHFDSSSSPSVTVEQGFEGRFVIEECEERDESYVEAVKARRVSEVEVDVEEIQSTSTVGRNCVERRTRSHSVEEGFEGGFVTEECEERDESDVEAVEARRVSEVEVDVEEVQSTSTVGRSCVARRTRSHFGSSSFTENNLGTFSHPICFDANEDCSEVYKDSENEDSIDGTKRKDDNGDEKLDRKRKGCFKEPRERKRVCSDGGNEELGRKGKEYCGKDGKRKRVSGQKDESLFKLLANTIWEKGGNFQQQEASVEKPILLKFNFGKEEPKPVEKTEEEKQMDAMWEEYDFVLEVAKLGSVPVVETEDHNEPNVGTDPTSLCSQGKHDFVLDEEIGIICRLCRFVKTEIKYILPPLVTSHYDRSAKKNYANDEDYSMWGSSYFQEASDDSQDPCVHNKGTAWDIFPGIREKMHPHQQEGFEFLWKNIAGGMELDKLKSAHSDSIGGCVISHAPGTGKTLLTIVFLQSYMEVFKECRPVIIAPCSMLLTWEEEFEKWKVKIPFHNLNSREFTGKEDELARKLVSSKSQHNKWSRMVKLLSWSKGKSVLGVSYSLFAKLAEQKLTDDEDKKRNSKLLPANQAEDFSRILLQKPSLLVLDEGHTPRNKRSHIWKALDKIKTERRIILSGTPFQNNFEELGNTLSLARPKFLDTISFSKSASMSDLHGSKKTRKEWTSLTKSVDDERVLGKIKAMMIPFVHVHKGSILKENLPGLRDCMVVLKTPLDQMELLNKVQKIQNHLELEHAIALVSIHPSLLMKCGLSRDKESCIAKSKISSKGYRLDPSQGVKTRFLMELIQLSQAKNEKVLVFSQFIEPLKLIKAQLRSDSRFKWNEGEEVLQMDGNNDLKHRQSMINHFNDPLSKVRVLLASTKACREGISLVGASRIVMLDVVWNPSVERQAISRAYRLGQKKIVYTYHLITSMELEKYRRQVSKDRLSELVFSSTQCKDKSRCSLTIQDDAILEAIIGNMKLKEMFEDVIYQPKESHLIDTYF